MRDARALIAIDEDDEIAALKVAAKQWATGDGSRAVIVGVAPSLSMAITNPKIVSLAKDAEGMLLAQLRERIDELRDDIGAPCEQHLVCGRPADEIIKTAVLQKADLVVKAADRGVGENSPPFGSVEKKLIRKCPTPVWIVRTERTEPPRRLAIAIDNPEAAVRRDEAELLAASLFNHAIDLATRFGITAIDVIHAWTAHAVAFLSSPRSGLSPEDLENYVAEWKQITTLWFDRVIAEANEKYAGSGVTFTPKLVMGEPKQAIPQAAAQLGTDLLVMGSANRSGVPGLFIGNTAEGVIDQLECSVYVVKPEGFKSVLAPNLN